LRSTLGAVVVAVSVSGELKVGRAGAAKLTTVGPFALEMLDTVPTGKPALREGQQTLCAVLIPSWRALRAEGCFGPSGAGGADTRVESAGGREMRRLPAVFLTAPAAVIWIPRVVARAPPADPARIGLVHAVLPAIRAAIARP
jgi:hypothetical protein